MEMDSVMKLNFKTYLFKFSSLILVLVANFSFVSSAHANTIIKKIEEIESQLGARIGVSIYDVTDNKLWNHNGDTRFPLMSTFKTLACAKLLDDVEKGLQSFSTPTVITKSSLVK
jgi:beta-lactamase class A